MRFEAFSFGSIRIDGITYNHDVIIDRGEVHKRKKKASKRFRDDFGHTPLSVEERIPWKCRSLVIGTGTGALPVMDEVKQEARRRKIAYPADRPGSRTVEGSSSGHKCNPACDLLNRKIRHCGAFVQPLCGPCALVLPQQPPVL